MNVIMDHVADRMRELNLALEKQLRQLMRDTGLTEQQIAERYTRIEWPEYERTPFNAVSSITFHSAIVANENVDSFLVALENKLLHPFDPNFSALVLGV